jgi:hypothetical protein
LLLDIQLLICSCFKFLALVLLEERDSIAICCNYAAVKVNLVVFSKDLFLFRVKVELIFLLSSKLLIRQTKRIVSLDTYNPNASYC